MQNYNFNGQQPMGNFNPGFQNQFPNQQNFMNMQQGFGMGNMNMGQDQFYAQGQQYENQIQPTNVPDTWENWNPEQHQLTQPQQVQQPDFIQQQQQTTEQPQKKTLKMKALNTKSVAFTPTQPSTTTTQTQQMGFQQQQPVFDPMNQIGGNQQFGNPYGGFNQFPGFNNQFNQFGGMIPPQFGNNMSGLQSNFYQQQPQFMQFGNQMGVNNNFMMQQQLPQQQGFQQQNQQGQNQPFFGTQPQNQNAGNTTSTEANSTTGNKPFFGIQNQPDNSIGIWCYERPENKQEIKKIKDQKKKQNIAEQQKPKIFKRLLDDTNVEKKKLPKQKVTEQDLLSLEIDLSKFTKVDEDRQPINIVFIGHVDSGKSTTCGNILLKMGKVDMNDLRKYEQEAKENHRDTWYLAYIMDINDEERQKGKTVEVGKAFFQTEHRRFTLLDAPGHKNYVPNMLSGAAQSDVAVLVISAKQGEFESGFEKGGQTQEHALLVRNLGVKYLLVAVNKMDEVNWSQDRFKYIQTQLMPFLKTKCGFDTESAVQWVPYSGLFGNNMDVPVATEAPWYQGPTLFQALDQIPPIPRDPNADLRIPILDKFKDQGLFLFGKIESGCIKVGQQVTLMPLRNDMTIVQIQNSDDQNVAYAKAGENIKIRVKDIEDEDVERGMIICNNDDFCQVTFEVETSLDLMELPEHKPLFSAGYVCVLHMHTIQEEVEVTRILSVYNPEQKTQVKTSFLKSGQAGKVRIRSKNYICCEKFEQNEHLGVFTLRDEGRTIGMGKIERVKPIKKEEQLNLLAEQALQMLKEKQGKEEQKYEDDVQEKFDNLNVIGEENNE